MQDRSQPWVLLVGHCPLGFLRQGISVFWSSPSKLGLWASEPLGSICLYIFSARSLSPCHCIWLLHGCWGFEPRPLCGWQGLIGRASCIVLIFVVVYVCVCLPMPIWSAVHMHASSEAKSWFLVSSFITLYLVFRGSFSFSQELAIWLSWLASKARSSCCLCSSPSSALTGACHLTWPLQACSESEFISSYLCLRHFTHWAIPSAETSFFERQ